MMNFCYSYEYCRVDVDAIVQPIPEEYDRFSSELVQQCISESAGSLILEAIADQVSLLPFP